MGSTWQAGWKLVLGLVIQLACAGACFSPDVQEGLACSPTGSCPFLQACVNEVCVDVGSEDLTPDAASSVIATDASGGDAGDGCPANTVQCGDECLAECTREFATAGEMSFQPARECTYLRVHAWGAGGGHGTANLLGGGAGYAMIERAVTSNEVYTLIVGAPGTNAAVGAPGIGGTPGGGSGGTGNKRGGGGAGGYSGLFLGGTAAAADLVM